MACCGFAHRFHALRRSVAEKLHRSPSTRLTTGEVFIRYVLSKRGRKTPPNLIGDGTYSG